jgi:hypothetical protein
VEPKINLYRALGRKESKEVRLRLLFDTKSIEKMIPKLSRRALAVLRYYDINPPLIFRRTEYPPKTDLLQKIPSIKVTQESGRACIEAPEAKIGLREDFEIESQSLAQHILKKQFLTQEEIEVFRLLFIQEALNQLDTDGFLVTENLTLLSHRIEIEKIFSTTPLNISSLDEMAEFLDLTFKYNSIYLSSPHIEVSENLWYWYSFRLKIPHYNVDFRPREGATLGEVLSNSLMDGFSQRAGFLLSALDEMGFQYFSGVDNNTQASMVYHFNYFILLMTGVFDSLALQAMDKYQLTFDGSHIPSRISLNTDSGRDYLRALEEKNPQLRQHYTG